MEALKKAFRFDVKGTDTSVRSNLWQTSGVRHTTVKLRRPPKGLLRGSMLLAALGHLLYSVAYSLHTSNEPAHF